MLSSASLPHTMEWYSSFAISCLASIVKIPGIPNEFNFVKKYLDALY